MEPDRGDRGDIALSAIPTRLVPPRDPNRRQGPTPRPNIQPETNNNIQLDDIRQPGNRAANATVRSPYQPQQRGLLFVDAVNGLGSGPSGPTVNGRQPPPTYYYTRGTEPRLFPQTHQCQGFCDIDDSIRVRRVSTQISTADAR